MKEVQYPFHHHIVFAITSGFMKFVTCVWILATRQFEKSVSMLRTFIPDMSQHNAQGLDRKSWIPISSPSSPMSRAAPPTPTLSSSSRLAPYTPASYLNASPRTARKLRNDISDDEKQEIRMAFELFDSRKVGKLSYREMKVCCLTLSLSLFLFLLTGNGILDTWNGIQVLTWLINNCKLNLHCIGVCPE